MTPQGALPLRKRDALDVFIEQLHWFLGHDKTALFIGVSPDEYDRRLCRLCHPEIIHFPNTEQETDSE